jgi:hypothetical protein
MSSVSLRRIKANYQDLDTTKKALLSSSLYNEMNGAAFDEKAQMIYISLQNQKAFSAWSRFDFLINIVAWESRENIKTFADKNHLIFVAGDLYSEMKIEKPETSPTVPIKEKIMSGIGLDEQEVESYLLNDFKTLDLIFQNRPELVRFEKYFDGIKERIATQQYGLGDYPLKKFRKLDNGKKVQLVQDTGSLYFYLNLLFIEKKGAVKRIFQKFLN